MIHWRDIPGHKGYAISSNGEVRSTVTNNRIHSYQREGREVVPLLSSYKCSTIPVADLHRAAFGSRQETANDRHLST